MRDGEGPPLVRAGQADHQGADHGVAVGCVDVGTKEVSLAVHVQLVQLSCQGAGVGAGDGCDLAQDAVLLEAEVCEEAGGV